MKVNMKALLFVGLLATGLLMSAVAKASDIEEVIVIGANTSYGYADPETDYSLIEALDPTRTYQPGGIGGFVGATTHGTDTKHTTVYRNGIPVNDPGSGWYDFGTELPTFQTMTAISGPNSALYGSSSMAGTILMEDNFDGKNMFMRLGDDMYSIQGGTESFHLSTYKGSNGSVRTDNTEEDWFENVTLKTKKEFGQWNMITVLQDYKYDYDNCWFGLDGNDCVQEGFKTDVSIRGDWLTVGYSSNDVKHNTGWESKNERYFVDANKEVIPGLVIGAQNNQEKYNDAWDNRTAGYLNYNINEHYGLGYRFEENEHIYRLGYESGGFKLSFANSFRKPNLYERYGDDWVFGNPNLQPEKGKGVEASIIGITLWHYEFSQSIDYNFSTSSYINAGGYDSTGIKYNKNWMLDEGNLNVSLGYTDSDRIRVPKQKIRISWSGTSTDGRLDYRLAYIGQYNKGNDFDGSPIDDVSTFNFNLGYYITPKYRLGFQIRDILDRDFEILPNYGAGGREFSLSLDLSL